MALLRRNLVLVALVVAVLVLQVWLFDRRIPEIPLVTFEHHAVPLKIEPDWLYGYVSGMHGAFLVKAKKPGRPLSLRAHADSDLDPLMGVQLSTLPRRAGLEAVFYIGVLVWCFIGIPRSARFLARGKKLVNRKAAIDALLAAVTVLLVLLPLLVAGYGASVFTTWTGPGAMSSSGPYLALIGQNPAETVSYRGVAEAILILPTFVGGLGSNAVEWFLETNFWRGAVEMLPSQRAEDLPWVLYYWSVVLGTYMFVGVLLGKLPKGWRSNA